VSGGKRGRKQKTERKPVAVSRRQVGSHEASHQNPFEGGGEGGGREPQGSETPDTGSFLFGGAGRSRLEGGIRPTAHRRKECGSLSLWPARKLGDVVLRQDRGPGSTLQCRGPHGKPEGKSGKRL